MAFVGGRVVCWFSHGAASAIATKIALARWPAAEIVCIDTGSEHPDNERFRADCEEWFGRAVNLVKSEKFANIFEVFDGTGYLVGPGGARCTTELKKRVRHVYERPTDVQVFGYTSDRRDVARADRFLLQNPGVDARFPLIERELTKADCLALLQRAGIMLPAMYVLGYSNNNCLGCVKGGKGYWNKIRVDFPEVFQRMAAQERKMNRTVLREYGAPLFLDELPIDAGNYKGETPSDCSLDCQTVEKEFA